MNYPAATLLILAIFSAGAVPVMAQSLAEMDKEMRFTVPFWWPATHGTFEVRDFESEVDVDLIEAYGSLPDFIEALDFILVGQAEFRVNNFLLRAGGYTVDLSSEKEIIEGLLTLDGEFAMRGLRLEGGFRLGDFLLSDVTPSLPNLSLTTDLFLGLTYSEIGGDVSFGIGPGLDATVDWLDATAGARLTLASSATSPARITLEGHIGGGDSDFAWDAKGTFDYSFTDHIWLSAGWRAAGVNVGEELPRGDFNMDVFQHGPLLEMSLRF